MSALTCPNCGHEYAPRRLPLTPRQAAILRYIEESVRTRGFAPSLEEIAARFCYASLSTVHEHLSNLARKGYICRRFNEARSIEVLVRLDDIGGAVAS